MGISAGVDELTATWTRRTSCYFGRIEPAISFGPGGAMVLLGAGLAYYSASLNSGFGYESTFDPGEPEMMRKKAIPRMIEHYSRRKGAADRDWEVSLRIES